MGEAREGRVCKLPSLGSWLGIPGSCRAGLHRNFFHSAGHRVLQVFGYLAVIDAFISINAFGPLGAPTLGLRHRRLHALICDGDSRAAEWAAGKLGRSPIYRRFPHCESVRHPFALQLTFRDASKKHNPSSPLSQIRTCACHPGDPLALPLSQQIQMYPRPSPPGYSLSDEPLPYYVTFFLFFYSKKAHAVGVASNRFTIVMRNSLPPCSFMSFTCES
jgi:hypothetical protein